MQNPITPIAWTYANLDTLKVLSQEHEAKFEAITRDGPRKRPQWKGDGDVLYYVELTDGRMVRSDAEGIALDEPKVEAVEVAAAGESEGAEPMPKATRSKAGKWTPEPTPEPTE